MNFKKRDRKGGNENIKGEELSEMQKINNWIEMRTNHLINQ
jgi:hypothetical protein